MSKISFKMIRSVGSKKTSKVSAADAHGGTILLGGDEVNGFYGEIPKEDFLTAQQMSDLCNFHLGVLDENYHISWMKFVIDGKILLIPKPGRIRYGVSWNQIYQAGMVYGDDTYGTFPSGVPVLQNKKIVVDGITYRVRMLSGSPGEPVINHMSAGGWNKYESLKDTEYGKIFFPIISRQMVDEEKWWDYSESELGFASPLQWWYFIKESFSADGIYVRPLGYYSADYLHTANFKKTTLYGTFTWSPVLELVS